MKVRNSFLWLLLFVASILNASDWQFDSRYSTVQITDNGTFTNNFPIANWDGTLARSSAGTISGEQISFVDGLLEDAGNQILLNAIFDPTGTIFLSGNTSFRAEPGSILQTVSVSNSDNILRGSPIFSSAVALADASTTLTLGIQSQMNQNLVLNGGTVTLENDLVFTDGSIILGDGTINGNNYKVKTGGDPFTWTSNITWCTSIELSTCVDFTGSFTFSEASSTVNGNGYVLDLTGGGVITVGSGVTLTLSDIVVKGLGNGAGFGKILLTDATSTLVLTNVTLLFSDDFTTSVGDVEVKGPTTAVVKDHDWLFDMTSSLTVDCLTLWKDTAGAETCGDILFEAASNLGLINDGIIDYITLRCHSIIGELDSCCDILDSRVDILESCCEANDSRLDIVESCCEANDSRIDIVESCCEANDSRLDIVESCCDALDSRTDILESCCEANDSRIDIVESCCEANDSRLDIVESCCDVLDSRVDIIESELDVVDSRIDVVESCCEANDSRLDIVESCCDALDSRTDILESCCEANDSRIDIVESCCEANDSRIDLLESEIDTFDSRIDLVESCCEANDSRIDLLESEIDTFDSRIDIVESCCDVLDSRVDILESEVDTFDSRIDVVESCCEANDSRLDVLESQIDNIEGDTSRLDDLDSRVDLLESCCEANDSRIDIVESCCDVLDSRVDILESEVDVFDSRIDVVESCCEANDSRIDILESRIDELSDDDSRLDILESCCEANDSRLDIVESCCEANDSRIDILESRIEELSDDDSRLDILESCCEANDSRLDIVESCCDVLDSRVDILESRIDELSDDDSRLDILESCCEANDSRLDIVESCCEALDSRVDILESEIDELSNDDSRLDILESCCEANDSRLDIVESCCEANDSRIDILESRIEELSDDDSRLDLLESCCEANDSRLDIVESCCDVLDSRVDVLESEIDEIVVSLPDDLDSRLDILESCCEANDSRLDIVESCCEVLDSRVDILESEIDTIVTQTCVIPVCGDVKFDLSMLPGEGEAVLYEFCKCYESKLNPPSVIFDPACFGNNGCVELPKGSRLAFCGFGTVELKDGVTFKFTGTVCDGMGVQADWPELLLDECACMVLDMDATVTIGGGTDGAGCINMRKGGSILLDQPNSHLIFGQDCKNEIIIHASLGSHITVNNSSALISYHLGTFDLIFDNHSALQISDGTIEMNTMNCFESPGVIRKFEFLNDSCLVLPGQCDKTLGVLRLAPNDPNSCCVPTDSQNVMFNNLEGQVCGNGDLQFVSFDDMGNKVVNSTTRIQNNQFCITAPMVDVFMELSYLLEPGLIPPPDATILALQGTRPDLALCGRLVAFCPSRNGSIVGLAQGDHDVFYDSSESCGTLDLVRGYDRLGRVFTIADCNENTRTPPAPPLT